MKSKLARGMLWMGTAKVIVNLLALLSTLVLARLLTPEDFGLVALATAMLTIIASVTELSLSSALIHHEEPTEAHFHSVWTLNLCRAVVIGLLFCAAAPVAARFYDEPRLLNIMLVIGGFVMVSGVSNPKTVMLTRNLVFWQEFAMAVSQKLAGVLVGIAIALVYKTYWALVAGMFASQAVGIVVSYLIIPYRPRLSFSHARELWSFSVWLSLGQIVNTLNWKFDHLLVGAYLGPKALGLYTVGDNLANMPTRETVGPIEATLFPGFKQIVHDNSRLQLAYRNAQSLILAMALPMGVGFALIAHPLVLLAMGEKWLPAVDVIQVLACVFALQTLASPVHSLALAKGETKLLFQRDLLSFVIRLPIIVTGMLMAGLMGIIYARAISGMITLTINMHLARRLIGTSVREQLVANTRALLSVLLMVAGVLSLEYMMGRDGTQLALLVKIGVFVVTGALLYTAMHFLLWWLARKPAGPETEIIEMVTKLAARFKRSQLT